MPTTKADPPILIARVTATNNLDVLLAQARVVRGLVIRGAPTETIVKRVDTVIKGLEWHARRRKKRK